MRKARKGAKTPEVWGGSFPEGFLWGTGEDAYQHEGGNLNNDWARWEASDPPPIKNGDRCLAAAGFWERWREDFDRCEADGHRSHRIGIEWSRVEPERGRWDEGAFARYGEMLADLKRRGFVVFLNLWHFTLPLWAADSGGWENPGLMGAWERYVAECGRRFGRHVDWWSTMIDSQIYALNGYALGAYPPCQRDMGRALAVYRSLVEAHARARRVLHEIAPVPAGVEGKARVGMIYFFFRYEAGLNPLDRFARSQLERIFNRAFLEALDSGVVSLNVPGGPRLREEIAGARDSLDWLGVNYYTREIVSFDLGTPGFLRRATSEGSPLTDMGWEIHPEGLYALCKDLERRFPGKPLFITESGCADAADRFRPAYILEHLAWLKRLVDEGCPVKGFAYWSLTDNWEWAEGFYPKFGLYRVDRGSLEREQTASARLFAFIARNNRLPTREEAANPDFGLAPK